MTARIREFLKQRKDRDEGPCLVLDLDVVRENYLLFAKALPDTRVFYAVKANPAPEVLELLAELGSCFDVASVSETEAVLAAGATPERISYGNTIKKESEIAAAAAMGVTLFAIDCEAEVEKVARALPARASSAASIATAPGPNGRSRASSAASRTMLRTSWSSRTGLGSSRTGSPSTSARSSTTWKPGTARSPRPRRFSAPVPSAASRSPWSISAAAFPRAMCARRRGSIPTAGRSFAPCAGISATRFRRPSWSRAAALVGNAGIIEAEVVLIAKRSPEDELRWVYLDIGKFHGLAETIDESIRYPIRTLRDRDETSPCIIAGPTCDSVDVLYEKNPYPLPVSLAIGDKVLIEATGAYTATYSSVGFNGYPPLRQYVI